MALLYIQTTEPFAATAARIFAALGATDVEEHDSDNFPGGDYFKARCGGMTLRVSREAEDDPFHDLFQVLLSIKVPASMATPPAEVARMAAPPLLQAGLVVADRLPGDEDVVRWRVFGLAADGEVSSSLLERARPPE